MTKRAKLRVISKLQVREIIPTSIRFNFELSGSKEVTGNDNFFGLAASCSMAIQTCQADLKHQMAQAAQMEVDVIDKKSRALFHQALQGFAHLILIDNDAGPVQPTAPQIRELALITLDQNVDYFTKPHNFHLDRNTLFSDYKLATEDANPTWTLGSATQHADYVVEHAADIERLTSLMYETIVHRWLTKCRAMSQKEKASRLDSAQRSFFHEASTKEAAAAIALEKSMDESKMNAVIENKIAKENKALRAQIRQLENSVRRTNIQDAPKNSRRGASKAGASKQKTNTKKEPPQPPSSQHNKAKQSQKPATAAAAANANSRRGDDAKQKKKNKKKNGPASKENKKQGR